jgi:hypothetical protein
VIRWGWKEAAASVGGLAVGLVVVDALIRVQSKRTIAGVVQTLPGITVQPPNLASIAVGPGYSGSVQLARTPGGGLSSSIALVFDASGTIALSGSDVAEVTRTAAGATVRAIGAGSALVTISFPGAEDALVGIAVY